MSNNVKRRGRKPSFFRKNFDSRLALLSNKSYFLVRLTEGMDAGYLQRLVSNYVCCFEKKYRYTKQFSTQKVANGIRIHRVY